MKLKKLLKQIKLNEENISMVLGALVIVIVGVLVVNYFKDKNGQTLPEALTTINQTQVGKTHTVTKGETLWSISEEVYGSGYNWVDLYKSNNLKSEKIEVGQKIEIPDVTPKQQTVAQNAFTKTAEQAMPGTYTVVHGDTLWTVAVKTYGDGYKWTLIAKANKLTNPNVIHAGNVLTLPR